MGKRSDLKQLSRGSVGEADAGQWMARGSSLRASARVLRAAWVANRRNLKRFLRIHRMEIEGKIEPRKVNSLSAFNYDVQLLAPTFLLLGYAAELYLKACVAKVMWGCSEKLFISMTRFEFSHKLLKIAEFIDFPMTEQIREDLNTLEEYILEGGRYPFSAVDQRDFIKKHNQIRSINSDAKLFRRLCRLVDDIFLYSHKLAGTTGEPVSEQCWSIHDDGYVAYRSGGGLSPRITYRLSTELRESADPASALQEFISAIPTLGREWNTAKRYEEIVKTEKKVKLEYRHIRE